MRLIRAAEERDLPAILAIESQTPWRKSEYLRRRLAAGNVLIAQDAAGVTGFIVCNREFFSLPFVWLVAVSKEHRGKGIASALYAHVEQTHKGMRLYSSTNESHAAMRRFFERRGYTYAGCVDLDPGDPEVFYRIDL